MVSLLPTNTFATELLPRQAGRDLDLCKLASLSRGRMLNFLVKFQDLMLVFSLSLPRFSWKAAQP